MRLLAVVSLAVALTSFPADLTAQTPVQIPAQPAGQAPGRPVPAPGGPAQFPPRDWRTAEPAPAGTGVIRGRVVAADSGQPLRGARVTISAPEIREARGALTDDAGRVRDQGTAGRPLHAGRQQGRLRQPVVRPAAPVRVAAADRTGRGAGAREGRFQPAARRGHRRPRRGRVRRAGDRGDGAGGAPAVHGRPTAAHDGRTDVPDRRPGTVPPLRASAGRLLRLGRIDARRRPSRWAPGRPGTP